MHDVGYISHDAGRITEDGLGLDEVRLGHMIDHFAFGHIRKAFEAALDVGLAIDHGDNSLINQRQHALAQPRPVEGLKLLR